MKIPFFQSNPTESRFPPLNLGFTLQDIKDTLFKTERLPISAYVIAFALIFITYLYQSIIPAFNADDIYHLQKPNVDLLYLGRWGTYFLFVRLFDSNPVPVISTLFGSGLLLYTGYLAGKLFQFRLAVSQFLFLLIGAISIFYGSLFGYEISRVAYPIANILAVGGLYLILRNRYILGLALIALSPHFYSAGIELAAVVLVSFAIHQLVKEPGYKGFRLLIKGGLALLIGTIIYVISRDALAAINGLPISPIVKIDPLAIFERAKEFGKLFKTYSFPLITKLKRYEVGEVWIGYYAAIVFLVFLGVSLREGYRNGNFAKAFLIFLLNALSLITPYCLILVQQDASYPVTFRSLYGFSMLHAFWLASLIDYFNFANLAQFAKRAMLSITIGSASLLTLSSSVAVNQWAFDNYLASQSDLLATSRVITRIDNLMAANGDKRKGNIPLAVIINDDPLAGPRGHVRTARFHPWSREWIFRFIDQRFHPVTSNQMVIPNGTEIYERALAAAQSHGQWPAKDSVFMMDDVVVVVLIK